MYTGYSIRNQKIYKDEGKTPFKLSGNYIHGFLGKSTGCCLAKSLSEGVKHIYGPGGYTKFYVNEGYIYGPSTHLPWFDSCRETLADEPQVADAIAS
jgi:hypothetical protein